MKSILEELFDGNINPAELIIPRNPEYRPLNRKISDTILMWKDKLSEHDFQELEELLDLRSQADPCTPKRPLYTVLNLPYGS
ncbi:DUF6809 family protein [Paenibacillus macerans]|nr:DUF6809 family protein [Paenibacillus macerans]SUA86449.1 Uncharacterised protein [Paenibacillus macerans]